MAKCGLSPPLLTTERNETADLCFCMLQAKNVSRGPACTQFYLLCPNAEVSHGSRRRVGRSGDGQSFSPLLSLFLGWLTQFDCFPSHVLLCQGTLCMPYTVAEHGQFCLDSRWAYLCEPSGRIRTQYGQITAKMSPNSSLYYWHP